MATTNDQDELDSYNSSFCGLPILKVREKMDVLQLAELLLSRPKGSPAYIVLEHEFNTNIAKLRTKATINADMLNAGVTILAVILAAVLGYYIGTSQI